MTAATILTMSNGKGVDLLNVQASDIDFSVIAEHLAKEKRFNGATPGMEYSVAQHCCIGTEAILKAGGTEEEAAYFLLHDCHEALLKDDTTPKKKALAELAEREFGVLSAEILNAFDMLTDRVDAAIHEAALMPWPMSAENRRIVKLYDIKMFVTEWRDVMLGQPHPNWHPYEGVQPLEEKIEAWPWVNASARWLFLAKRLLPSMRRKFG